MLNYFGKQYADAWHEMLNLDSETRLEKLLQRIDFDIQFCYSHPKYVTAWLAFRGESRGNIL